MIDRGKMPLPLKKFQRSVEARGRGILPQLFHCPSVLVARTPALAPTPMLLNRPNLYNYQKFKLLLTFSRRW